MTITTLTLGPDGPEPQRDDPDLAQEDLIPIFGYVRQSLTRDGSESYEIQQAKIEWAAPLLGCRIVRWYIEPKSTSGFKNRGRSRKEFPKMLAALKKGEAKGIMAFKTSRFSRGGGPGWFPVYEAIEEAGLDADMAIAIASPRPKWLSESEVFTSANRDREESKEKQDWMTEVRGTEAQRGEPRQGGRRAFGYEKDLMTIIPAEAELIREAVRKIIAGSSPYSIARSWNDRGVPGPSPNESEDFPNIWKAQTIKRIVISGRIAGQREHHGKIVADATWPAIIDKDTAARVRLEIKNRSTGPRPVRPRTFLLSGFLKCACGAVLVTRRRKAGPPSKPGFQARREYNCQVKESGGSHRPSCGALAIHADPIEAWVKERTFGVLLDPKAVSRLLTAAPHADEERDLGEEIRAAKDRRGRVVDMRESGAIDKEDFEARLLPIDNELDDLFAELTADRSLRLIATLPTTEAELEALWAEESMEWRQLLVRGVFREISVKRGSVPLGHIPERLTYKLR